MKWEYIKPPIGVVPKNIWEEIRIKELSRAIHDYIEIGKYETVIPWVSELNELINHKVGD